MTNRIKQMVKTLQLQEHPEGGYYRETYRSTGVISKRELGKDYSDLRHFSTCIYYLLTANTFSAFHRIPQDEIWHFYQGSPLRIHIITAEGDYQKIDLGSLSKVSFEEQEKQEQEEQGRVFAQSVLPQGIVPGKSWFAAEVLGRDKDKEVHSSIQDNVQENSIYALVGCTVAPGFHFADFELAQRENLISEFPQYSELITRLTR